MTEEIARLIDRAVWALGHPYDGDLVKARVLKECLDALRTLAQENAGLNTIAYQRWEIANARIGELEAERDAIKAKTIEECEQAIIEYGKKNGVSRHTHGPLAAIRAKNIT